MTGNEQASRSVSIVIPCYNEEENIAPAVEELLRIGASSGHAFEIVVVNDGSRDASSRVIHELASTHSGVVAVDLMRNFGQTQAYQVGMDLAQGDYLVLYSADRETPAEEVLAVIRKLDEGVGARLKVPSGAR